MTPHDAHHGRDWFAAVLAEVADEHHRALEHHGFTDEHDDRRSDADFGWLLLRRASELVAPQTVLATTPEERRRAFVEVAHIAASAVAAHDRRAARSPLPEPVTEHDLRAALDLGPAGINTSADASWRYVTRPGGETIERHTLTCAGWNSPHPADPCTGECTTTATDEQEPE